MVGRHHRWPLSSLCTEFIDAFVVAAIVRAEDGIGDVTANQLGDGLDHTFFSADDQLIDDVQLVGFLLCLRLCSD
jgi:hypothetical protein